MMTLTSGPLSFSINRTGDHVEWSAAGTPLRAGRFTLSGNEKSILAVWNSSDASVEWTFESAGGAVLCRLAPQEFTVIPDMPAYSVSSIKNT